MSLEPNHQDRIARLRASLSDDQALLVTDPLNIRYLVGFTGSNGSLLVTQNEVKLATDSRYEIQSAEQTSGIVITIDRDLFGSLLGEMNCPELVVEGKDLSVIQFAQLKQRFPKLSFTVGEDVVEKLRVIKDAYELEMISKACEISTQALSELPKWLTPGVTELEIAFQLEQQMRRLGADDKAFETIVAGGLNSAIPHHEPTTKVVEVGDLLKIDFGAKVAGYHSDCTRTFVVGSPSAWQRELYDAVFNAQAIGREMLKPKVTFSSVVSAVTESLNFAGYGKYFSHGLGHGVGLAIHENPFFAASDHAKIDQNTVITVEPGAYLPGQGGVRIEDTVVITDDGYLNLTEFSHDLIEL